jgi:hypothetical protein
MIWFCLDTSKGVQEGDINSKIEDKCMEIKRGHLHIRRMSNRVKHAPGGRGQEGFYNAVSND